MRNDTRHGGECGACGGIDARYIVLWAANMNTRADPKRGDGDATLAHDSIRHPALHPLFVRDFLHTAYTGYTAFYYIRSGIFFRTLLRTTSSANPLGVSTASQRALT